MQIEALNSLFPKKETTQTTPRKECACCEEPQYPQLPEGQTGIDWLDEFWVLVNGGTNFADDIGIDLDGLDFSRWSGALEHSPHIQYGGNINGRKSQLNNGFSLSTLASLNDVEEQKQAALHTLWHEYKDMLEIKEQELKMVDAKLAKSPKNQNLLKQKAILDVDVNDLKAKIIALEL